MTTVSTEWGGAERLPTAVAVDVLPLRPPGCGDSTATEDVELWPAFVLVVSEPTVPAPGSARPLFDVVSRPAGTDVVILGGDCDWSLADSSPGFLELTVRSTTPVRFAIRILVPAGRVLDVLDAAAEGGMIAITTREGAERLAGRAEIQRVLREVVMLCCPESPPRLASLARSLRSSAGER